MDDSVQTRLAAMAPVAAELNRTSDAFTEELRTVEEELGKLNLGIEVELGWALVRSELREDCDDRDQVQGRHQFETYLAYGKAQPRSGWRVLVRRYRVDLDVQDDALRYVRLDEKPLVEASRELRITAAGQIDALLRTLTEEANKKLAALRSVTGKAARA